MGVPVRSDSHFLFPERRQSVLRFDSILDSSGCIFPVIRLKRTTPGCLLWGKMLLPRRRPGKRALRGRWANWGRYGNEGPCSLPVWHDRHGMCWCLCVSRARRHLHSGSLLVHVPSGAEGRGQRLGSSTFDPTPERSVAPRRVLRREGPRMSLRGGEGWSLGPPVLLTPLSPPPGLPAIEPLHRHSR